MTALTTVPSLTASHASISGELLDALIKAIVFPPDPSARSALICNIVEEIYATVAWRQDGDDDIDATAPRELASIRQLVDAAHNHQQRMAASSRPRTDGDA